jgi:predicted porin
MRKTYFQIAIAGGLLSLLPMAASAQSSVTIGGIFGLGVASISGAQIGTSSYTAKSRLVTVAQDSKVPSRLVFRGTEDLGGGMTAFFLLDKGFNGDDGTDTLGGAQRETLVGLRGSFGAVTLGRQFHPLFNVRDDFDPTADSSNLMVSAAFRMNNSVMYRTPVAGGFWAKFAYGFGEVSGSDAASRAVGAYIGYEKGPLAAKFGFNNLNDNTGLNSAKNTLMGASYNFGMATLFGEYGLNKGVIAGGNYVVADSTDSLLGVRVPYGANTFAVSFIRKDDKTATNADASQLQIYYGHSLSKRTTLYSIYTKINNSATSNFTTSHAPSAPTAAQFALGARPADTELSAGIRHSF